MGKKKNKKQNRGEASNSFASEDAFSGRSNGFSKKSASQKQLPSNPGQKNQKKFNKNNVEASQSGKRKGKFSGPNNTKKMKQNNSQPGRFVRISQESSEGGQKVTPKKSKNKKNQKTSSPKNMEIVRKIDVEDDSETFEDSEDSFEDFTDDSSFQSISSSDYTEDYFEDYDFQSNSDDTYSFSDEEDVQEEFSTDTDYTEDEEVSEYSDYRSDEDGDYEPGEQYDDLIVQPGEAKYIEISDVTKVHFHDQSTSEIIDYFSDTNEEKVTKKAPRRSSEKLVDPCKDSSKAVVHVGDVSLDRHPEFSEEEPENEAKRRKISCSKNCSHQLNLPKVKKSVKESPLKSLVYDKEAANDSSRNEEMEVVESPQEKTGEPEENTEEIDENTEEIEEDTEVVDELEINSKINFYNSIDSYHILLHLTESIHFYGSLSIKLLAGSASVSGYKLDVEETVKAYVPVGHSSVSITPNESDCQREWKESLNKGNKFIKEMFFEADLQEIEKNFKTNQAVLLLNRTSNRRTKMAKKYSTSRVFPNMINYKRPRLFASTEYILGCRFTMDRRYAFQVNPDWEMISLGQKSRIVVAGGKNVGKSTLIRHLVNENVKKFGKILLVDLDIGQPETFVPQTVSATLLDGPIIGMGCFAEKLPLKSYLFGDLNVANCPQTYIECVAKLMQDLEDNAELKNIPWVVNTMGYARGIGLELMIAVLRLISPTDVIQITHDIQLENFDHELTKDLVAKWTWTILDGDALGLKEPCRDFQTFIFHTMVSGNLAADIRKAKGSEIRQINLLAQLGGILGENCDWITQSKPVCAPLEKIKLFNFTDEDLGGEEHIYDLLNANLTYLCRKTDESDILECLGVGIVRGIDEFSRKLYLLPSTRDTLDLVNSLAICRIALPPQLILNQSSSVRGELPFVYNTDEAIGSRNVLDRSFRSEKAMSNIYSQENIKHFD